MCACHLLIELIRLNIFKKKCKVQPVHAKTNTTIRASSKCLDQSRYPPSLIRAVAASMKNLWFLSYTLKACTPASNLGYLAPPGIKITMYSVRLVNNPITVPLKLSDGGSCLRFKR